MVSISTRGVPVKATVTRNSLMRKVCREGLRWTRASHCIQQTFGVLQAEIPDDIFKYACYLVLTVSANRCRSSCTSESKNTPSIRQQWQRPLSTRQRPRCLSAAICSKNVACGELRCLVCREIGSGSSAVLCHVPAHVSLQVSNATSRLRLYQLL